MQRYETNKGGRTKREIQHCISTKKVSERSLLWGNGENRNPRTRRVGRAMSKEIGNSRQGGKLIGGALVDLTPAREDEARSKVPPEVAPLYLRGKKGHQGVKEFPVGARSPQKGG